MAILLKDLNNEDKSFIEPDLLQYFDEVTYETRRNWVMYYEENDFYKISTFDNVEFFINETEFEEIKIRLFLLGLDLYKIHEDRRIELWSERQSDIRIKRINI